MPEIIVKILGFCAGTLTTIAFVPQVLQVYRTRNTKDLSLGMFLVMSSGVALWLLYGILQQDWAVIVANAVTLPLALYIVMMKIKHK
jgi:MtN3 and saliva related transmembrane protein